MSIWRSVREYLAAILKAYQSFVLGLVFGVAGAIGLFTSHQSGVRALALVGVALGFLVAPFQAFHHLRIERDLAQSQGEFSRFRAPPHVNALSGSWAVDHFEPVQAAGIVVRAIIAAYPLAADPEVDSALLDRFRAAAATSAVDGWLSHHFGERAANCAWRLVSPSNGYEFTTERSPFLTESGGSEIWVRCMLLMPRGMGLRAPRVLVDLISRDVPSGSSPVDLHTRFELAGEPFRPDLQEIAGMVEALAETVLEGIGPVALPPLVHRRLRERILARWGWKPKPRIIGPNFDIRSKPRPLTEAIRLPDFPRLPDNVADSDILIETPARNSANDQRARRELLRRAFRHFLRQHGYRDFEPYVDGIGTTVGEGADEHPNSGQ